MRRSWILITVLAAACGSGSTPPPATGGGSAAPEPATGRERIGWTQQADDAAQLAAFRYAIYVDGVRSEVSGTTCASSLDARRFDCTASLPPLTTGVHTLELAAFVLDGDTVLESAPSAPLRVSVGASIVPVRAGWREQTITTRDGITLRNEPLADGLSSPVDAAFAADGTLFVAERAGAVRMFVGDRLEAVAAPRLRAADEGNATQILSLAVDPQFVRTRFVFVVWGIAAQPGTRVQLARYREVRGRLGEGAVVFDAAADAEEPSAVVRFGPDGKIYLAVGGPGASGTLVRLNADGSMPRDQEGTAPAIATGLETVGGLDWAQDVLWIADENHADAHLSAISLSPAPVRAIVRARQTIGGDAGAGALSFYASDLIPEMRGDVLMASAAGYILRVRVARDDPRRSEWNEKLFQDRAPAIRALTVSPSGAIYFCTDSTLARLVPQ